MTETPKELFDGAARLGLTAEEILEAWRITEMADSAVAEHPVPRRWHRCRMVFGHGDFRQPGDHYEFCACGAIRTNGERWTRRNSRRRQR